jgi:hypothetical protein
MKFLITFCFIFFIQHLIFPQQLEFILNVKAGTDNIQPLIVGYDPYGTDGLDPALGEENIPQVPSGSFGARFKLPADTNITTIKDIRFGCGQPFVYEHSINLSYPSGTNDMFIYWETQSEVIYLIFINAYSGEIIESFDLIFGADSFFVPTNLDRINVVVYYNGPLTWPEVYLHSPSGGEIFQAGQTVSVQYSVNIPWFLSSFLLQYSTNNGNDWIIIDTVSSLNNTYSWIVPNVVSNNIRFRIGDYPCVFDTSDGTFLIYDNNPPTMHPVELPIKINNSVGDTLNLLAGMFPGATNGLDTSLGETNQVPPLTGEFDAFLKLGDNSLSYIDYRPGYHFYTGVKNYYLLVYPKADSVTTLSFYLPEGLVLTLSGRKRVPFGWSPFDTTFAFGDIVYTLPPGTYYADNLIKLTFTFDGTIPVELVSFTASVHTNSITLNWITATELNNRGFSIERKGKLGDYWQTLGFVEGKGTTTEISHYSFIDEEVSPGKYFYRLKQIDFDGSFEYSNEIEVEVGIPELFYLHQNYPNPFNPTTKISWQSPVGSHQTIKVFDVLGREVATLVDEFRDAGIYEVDFSSKIDGKELTSGIYFYRLTIDSYTDTKKMILLR